MSVTTIIFTTVIVYVTTEVCKYVHDKLVCMMEEVPVEKEVPKEVTKTVCNEEAD